MWFGKAYLSEPPVWLRGQARLENSWVVLDHTRAEEYHPFNAPDLVFDLAYITKPADTIPFVRKYGLLWHGPEATDFRESYRDWENAALGVRLVLVLYTTLRDALAGDDNARRALWEQWEPVVGRLFEARATNDDELYSQVSKAIAWRVSEGLEGTQYGLAASVEWGIDETGARRSGPPGQFLISAHPPHLLGYAYHQLALALSNRVPLKACVECGRSFVVRDDRQRYCSSACGGRARFRRWAEKHRNKEGEDQ